MRGITLTFKKQVADGTDGFNNPTFTTTTITVNDCLVSPLDASSNIQDQQAINQARNQIYVHMPKTDTSDVGDSTVDWDGKTFKIDTDSTKYMDENTPTRWNRYFRGVYIDV